MWWGLMRQGVGTAGTSFRKEAASSASCSARQQQMHSEACLAPRDGLRLLEDVSFDLGKLGICLGIG